jgi:hypothetical protein
MKALLNRQHWLAVVSLIKDDLILSRLGMSTHELRERVTDELAWAYIVSLRPEELRDLAADPRVAGCTLVGAQLDI